MTLFRSLAIAVVIASIPDLCFGQQVYTLTPPDDIGRYLDSLRRNEGRAAATRALAARADAAPYLRVELLAARDPLFRKDLAETLATIESQTRERTKAQFPGWARARRFDLCTEALSTWPDKKEAVSLIDQVTPVLHQVGAEFARTHGLRFGDTSGFAVGERFDRWSRHYHYADESATIRRGQIVDSAIIRADVCELDPGLCDLYRPFAAIRSGLRYTPPAGDGTTSNWIHALVLVNNSAPLQRAESSLIVCDGDVELSGPLVRTLVISNGDILGKTAVSPARCTLCATGSITLPRHSPSSNQFHAGGTVTLAGDATPADRVKQRQKELPFGVRFLDPREFGLDLAADKAGLRVAGLAEWSPFARHGLQQGDVIVRVNGVAADTVPAFRRELRRGVVQESAVVHVRRGGETIGRIVFLDGIPTDPARVAPPPREVKR